MRINYQRAYCILQAVAADSATASRKSRPQIARDSQQVATVHARFPRSRTKQDAIETIDIRSARAMF